ncbi:hypothetical protein PMAYCL1PPCAC_04007, partial [Pristionchus mayeri]
SFYIAKIMLHYQAVFRRTDMALNIVLFATIVDWLINFFNFLHQMIDLCIAESGLDMNALSSIVMNVIYLLYVYFMGKILHAYGNYRKERNRHAE